VISSPLLSTSPRSTPSTSVSSTTATMLYVGNLRRSSSPCTVPLHLPNPGLLAITPRLFRNVIAWKFRNRIKSKRME
jgi:hypothetical protein